MEGLHGGDGGGPVRMVRVTGTGIYDADKRLLRGSAGKQGELPFLTACAATEPVLAPNWGIAVESSKPWWNLRLMSGHERPVPWTLPIFDRGGSDHRGNREEVQP